jgi:hypothetical protein
MFNIAGRVLDVYDDLQKELLKQNLEKVGNLKLDPADEIDRLANEEFAAVFQARDGRMIRKYPTHTPDATCLSGLYLEKAAKFLPPEATKVAASFIKKACKKHSIPVPQAIEKLASDELNSNIISLAGIQKLIKTAKVKHHALGASYPIETKEQVKQAEEYFNEHHMDFPPADRHEYANNTLKRAQELKTSVSADTALYKYAGADFGNMINSARYEREGLLGNDEMAVRTLKHLFEKRAALGPQGFCKELEQFDKINSLERHWDKSRGVRDPYRSTYENIKTASVIAIGDKVLPTSKLQKLAGSDILKTNFDESFCEQFAKDPVVVFQSLPRPEQQTLIQLAESL